MRNVHFAMNLSPCFPRGESGESDEPVTLSPPLNNSLKHAGATEIQIELGVQAGQMELRFSDNGRGFDPVARSTAGNGLTNLRRRIQDLGGTLEPESSPGAGSAGRVQGPVAGERKNEEGRMKKGNGRWEMGRS